jgi:hypothetical protein
LFLPVPLALASRIELASGILCCGVVSLLQVESRVCH